MKRFIGYILLCVCILFAAVVGFVPTVLSINPSADYSNGQYFIYKIEEKDGSDKNEGDILDGTAIETIADVFKDRLDDCNITSYEIEAEGNDTIRVAFKAEEAVNDAIASYLNFDWNMQVTDFNGKVLLESEDFFESGDAEIDYDNDVPIIVIELSNPEEFRTKIYENCNGSKNDEDEDDYKANHLFDSLLSPMDDNGLPTDSGSETSTANDNYIYIVNNWDSSYSLDMVINDPDCADTAMVDAYIDRIDATKPTNVYNDYDSKDQTKTCEELVYAGFLSTVGDDLALANKLATITCAKFNSDPLDYKVTLINKDYINDPANNSEAFIENLIYHGSRYGSFNSFVFSTVIISILIAFVLVSLFIFLNYGISGLTTISLTSSLILLTISFLNLFGAEFNIGCLVAIIVLALISLFSSLPYIRTVKEECMKGRNIKKANEEASSKTLMMQVDLSVISVLFGLVAYLIPNSYMTSIGVILIIGGLLNIIVNGIFVRVLMYFLTNSSYIGENLQKLKIDSKLIPDLTKDQKPTYFEDFKAEVKKPIKNKTLGFIAIAALMVGVISTVAFGIANGNIYNTNTNQEIATRVYIEFDYNENSSIKDVSSLETNVLDHLYTYSDSKTSSKNLGYDDVLDYTYSIKENYEALKEEIKTVYYIIELNDVLDENTLVSAYVDSTYNLEGVSLEDALRYLINDYNSVSNLNDVSVKNVTNVNNDSNNVYCLIWASISCGLVMVYFALRFGVARALISFLMSFGTMYAVTGLFSIVRLPVKSAVTFGVVVIGAFVFSVLDYFFAKEKSYLNEDHLKLVTPEDKKNESKFVLNLTFNDIIILVSLVALIVISFIFTTSFQTYFILFVVLGLFVSTWYIRYTLVDIIYALSGQFSKLVNSIKEKNNARRNAKLKNKKVEESDGPEEAIFIGIND